MPLTAPNTEIALPYSLLVSCIIAVNRVQHRWEHTVNVNDAWAFVVVVKLPTVCHGDKIKQANSLCSCAIEPSRDRLVPGRRGFILESASGVGNHDLAR